MRIDVHAHHYPKEFSDYMMRLGIDVGAAAAPGGRVTLDERIDLMDDAGIDLQVLCVGARQPYFDRPTSSLDAARFANDLYVDVCRRYNGRFAAFAAVPLPHVDEAIAEAGRCLDELGMVGVNLGCSVAGRPLDDPAFEPFWAEMDRRRAVVFFHPMGAGAGPMTNDYALTWMVGSCFEDTVTALRLVLSGLTARYPNVKIIIPHLGGTLPFLLQRLDDAAERYQAAGTVMGIQGNPSELVRKLYFDTVNQHPAALRCTCDSFGAGRLMLGTDFPYLAGPKFKRCVTYVQESGLPQQDLEQILDRTAQTLLNLPERAPSR